MKDISRVFGITSLNIIEVIRAYVVSSLPRNYTSDCCLDRCLDLSRKYYQEQLLKNSRVNFFSHD